ncbi:GyrI-like domain-containing protein [Petropleomorpha daqingensis]|uniref:Effector-binding domain-containing protein n=1 Tax=Petropleomorpha daqingensis TaxID=2026353 RepID=A0A853CI97_9ACTN|nr:GyrI-like domain-containing protein [Petropleomorpha daqingensis]NYJ07675.1 effector-binding domain-containing protein [Petropleomorpha daqingensis]
MDVVVREVPPSRTAVVRGLLDLSRIMSCFDAVYAYLRGGSTDVRQTGQNVALYRSDATMEIGVEVDRGFEQVGDVQSSSLPGGRVASAVHTTGYGDLHVTYDAIRDFCAARGLATTGDTWEIYGDPDENDHVDVEIVALLA